jgi:hypothetical protein
MSLVIPAPLPVSESGVRKPVYDSYQDKRTSCRSPASGETIKSPYRKQFSLSLVDFSRVEKVSKTTPKIVSGQAL